MIKTINTIQDLFKEINLDKQSTNIIANRYPIRYIFLPSFKHLRDIVSLLDSNNVKRIELRKIISNIDTWLTVDDIWEKVNAIENDDYVIIPLSELIRFFSTDSFYSLFNVLSGIENSTNALAHRRIYIPIVGLYERFHSEFYSQFHRTIQWSPIYNLSEPIETKIKIFVTNLEIDSGYDTKVIRNTSEWFDLWKNENIKQVLCVSDTLMHLFPNRLPDQVFDLERIENLKELLSKTYQISIPIQYFDQEQQFWVELFKKYGELKFIDINDLIRKVFNIVTLTDIELINLWITSANNPFKRWLLKNYILNKDEWKNKYIFKVMEVLQDLHGDELVDIIWLKIFDLKDNLDNYCIERTMLLNAYYDNKDTEKNLIEHKLLCKLNEINDATLQMKLITGITNYEKNLLISNFLNNPTDIPILQDKYKELYYYLSDIAPDNLTDIDTWIVEYFDEYRWSKVKDTISPQLYSLLDDRNKDQSTFYEWYFAFQDVKKMLHDEAVSKVLLIDAMGIEWLPLVVSFIQNELNLTVEKKYIAHSNLPTTTGNVSTIPHDAHILDFDALIHKGTYKYPISFINEMETLCNILKSNLKINNHERVALVSDHGLTALARLKESYKTFDYPEAEHEYRYMSVDSSFEEIDDFLLHEYDENDAKSHRLIALKYTSLYKKPVREVHGGATPEEVLVPIIIISRQDLELETYTIKLIAKQIYLKEPKVRFVIEPKPLIAPLIIINKKQSKLRYNSDKNEWQSTLNNIKIGACQIIIQVENYQKTFDINIIGGMQETELI